MTNEELAASVRELSEKVTKLEAELARLRENAIDGDSAVLSLVNSIASGDAERRGAVQSRYMARSEGNWVNQLRAC